MANIHITNIYKFHRYGTMGFAINLTSYFIYLVLTWLGMESKQAMTLVYLAGLLTGYFGHRAYSFKYQGGYTGSMLRFLGAHAAGYTLNLTLLYILSDRLGYPHQLIQALAIVLVAYLLYTLFNRVVFKEQQ